MAGAPVPPLPTRVLVCLALMLETAFSFPTHLSAPFRRSFASSGHALRFAERIRSSSIVPIVGNQRHVASARKKDKRRGGTRVSSRERKEKRKIRPCFLLIDFENIRGCPLFRFKWSRERLESKIASWLSKHQLTEHAVIVFDPPPRRSSSEDLLLIAKAERRERGYIAVQCGRQQKADDGNVQLKGEEGSGVESFIQLSWVGVQTTCLLANYFRS